MIETNISARVLETAFKADRPVSALLEMASDLLKKFWQPDGKTIDAANEKKLKEWMKNNGLSTDPGMITMFLHSDVLEDVRIKAVRDLGLMPK